MVQIRWQHACGDQLNVPVYKFLREPLIRAFGEEFYSDLEGIDEALKEGGIADD